MPPNVAYEGGYQDGLRRQEKASSRLGYPGVYDAGYRQGVLARSRVRRAIDAAGRFLLDLAVK